MRIIFALIVAMTLASTSARPADYDKWANWPADTKTKLDDKKKVIADLAPFRDSAVGIAAEEDRGSCGALYNAIIQRRNAEKHRLEELLRVFSKISRGQLDSIFLPALTSYDKHDADSAAITTAVARACPAATTTTAIATPKATTGSAK